ncbi:MAG: hypothetical protein LBT80_07100 [Lactobacillaceae bacterium]|jgi:MFS family permease|nr:hypothetical protein [Lactobacillaceae bacterium]
MTQPTKLTSAFWLLISGNAIYTAAQVLYSIIISYVLVIQYHADAKILSLYGAIILLPQILGFLASPWIIKIKKYTQALLIVMVLTTIGLLLQITVIVVNLSLVYVLTIALFDGIVSVFNRSINFTLMPKTLHDNEKLVTKGVDLSYWSGTVFSILTSLIIAFILNKNTYRWVLILIVLLVIIATALYVFIKVEDVNQTHINGEQRINVKNYIDKLFAELLVFLSPKKVVVIIFMEGFLGGLTGLLLTLLPLSMKAIGIPIAMFTVVKAMQEGGDLIGSSIAPLFKIKTSKFFIFDYILTGAIFAVLPFLKNIFLQAMLFLIAFIVIGISGNIFNKLIYEGYSYDQVGAVNTWSTAVFSIFGLLAMTIPLFTSNVKEIWTIIGIITFIFGVLLCIMNLKKPNTAISKKQTNITDNVA